MIDGTNAGAESANDALSLRDELAAEWEKLNTTTEAPAEQVAEPAEPTEGEVEETQEQRDARARDERGRFAKKAAEEASQKPQEAQESPETTNEPHEGKRYDGPPPGWSVAAKAAFDELPDAVKQAVAKREQEIDRGFAKLKEYKGLEPYADMARKSNIPLSDLMKGYYNAEMMLQQKPVEALLWLCDKYGVDPRRLAGNGQPQAQPQQGQQSNGIDPALAPIVQPLLQEINNLKQQLGRVDQIEQSIYQDKFATVSSQVERFFADPKNKFAENVADQMVLLINQANASGQQVDLGQIYETACYMNPEVRQALINEKLQAEQKAKAEKARQAANQARAAGASISGGSSVSQPTAEPDSENLRSLLERNMAAQMGRI